MFAVVAAFALVPFGLIAYTCTARTGSDSIDLSWDGKT